VFRRGRREHMIETSIGRIGVGICADNQYTAHLELMHRLQADLILMPHAWPTPARAGGPVSESDVAGQQRRMTDLPVLYARALGVPVVFANQVGPLAPMGGMLGRLMNPAMYRLRGQSRIIDASGSVLAERAEDEGALVAAAVMDPDRRHYQPQPSFGGWLQPGLALVRKVIIPLDIATEQARYTLSRERRRKARASLARTTQAASARTAAG
jgi:N-carbamoylputrescine amidase